MSEPTVCAVMLTADRPELAKRAVECFRRQTYPAKRLLILDSGSSVPSAFLDETVWLHCVTPKAYGTIGQLRNFANAAASARNVDILIHWDDDDYSHPNRIAEQVALLQSSGADCVGYRGMLFWRKIQPTVEELMFTVPPPAEAWLYSNPNPGYCLGTSLCYWRKTWERKPFQATSQGEDLQFMTGLKCVGMSAIGGHGCGTKIANFPPLGDDDMPRMIARIHAGNTSNAYRDFERKSEWRRAPEWDAYARSIMEAA